MAALNLVVIRSADIERAVSFYSCLGLIFEKQRHGAGPQHYASERNGCVFEIYPLIKPEASTSTVRLGFSVASLTATLQALAALPGHNCDAKQSSPGHAVVTDPDGHRVELTES